MSKRRVPKNARDPPDQFLITLNIEERSLEEHETEILVFSIQLKGYNQHLRKHEGTFCYFPT